jgi:hypothetical protein
MYKSPAVASWDLLFFIRPWRQPKVRIEVEKLDSVVKKQHLMLLHNCRAQIFISGIVIEHRGKKKI